MRSYEMKKKTYLCEFEYLPMLFCDIFIEPWYWQLPISRLLVAKLKNLFANPGKLIYGAV